MSNLYQEPRKAFEIIENINIQDLLIMKEKKESDVLTFRNPKGEEKKMTRGEFRNAARYASENYSHEVGKTHRPESTTPKDHQFQLVRE